MMDEMIQKGVTVKGDLVIEALRLMPIGSVFCTFDVEVWIKYTDSRIESDTYNIPLEEAVTNLPYEFSRILIMRVGNE